MGSTSLRRQLTSIHSYWFLFALQLSGYFWVIFLRSRGFSFAAIGIFETIFHISSFCSEVPTGYVADRLGRRLSLVIGRLAAILSSGLLLCTTSFSLTAIAFILSALSYTFHSGASEALIYDGLAAEGREQEYTKIIGALNGTYLLGASVAGVLGGFIAERSMSWLYLASILFDLVSIALIMTLSENKKPSVHQGSMARRTIAGDLRQLLQVLTTPGVAPLLLVYAGIAASASTLSFYGQSYLKSFGLPLALIGMTGTVTALLAVLPSRYAYRLEQRFGNAQVFAFHSVVIAVALILIGVLGDTGWFAKGLALLLYLTVAVAQEMNYTLLSSAVNRQAPSDLRATVLSCGGMAFSIGMMVIFPVVGFLADQIGMKASLLALGCWASMVCLVGIRRLRQPDTSNGASI